MRRLKQSLVARVVVSALVVLAVGLGCEAEPSPNRPVIPSNNLNDDAGPDIKPDTVEDVAIDPCLEVVCEAGEVCAEGVCEVVRVEGSACSAPFELGTLTAGEPLVAVADPTGWDNLLNTGCSADDASPQAVFVFSLAANARVRVSMLEAAEPMVMEVRKACDDGATALSCDTAPREFDGRQGETYYLVVEARRGWNVGAFKVELSATEQVCGPPGSWRCEGDQRVQCYAGEEERVFACAAGCENGVCAGDVCDLAIEVNGSIIVRGDSVAHESAFNFADQPTCSTTATAGPLSLGQDVVFKLPGLSVGQTISVDTTNEPNVNVIAISRSCGIEAGCVAADDTTGVLSWQVDEDGDYYVIIDKVTSSNTAFDYRIEILN